MKKITQLCSMFLILCLTTNVIAADIYVDATATGNADGTTWVDAYTNVTTAVNNAVADDTIHIAAGTYINAEISINKT